MAISIRASMFALAAWGLATLCDANEPKSDLERREQLQSRLATATDRNERLTLCVQIRDLFYHGRDRENAASMEGMMLKEFGGDRAARAAIYKTAFDWSLGFDPARADRIEARVLAEMPDNTELLVGLRRDRASNAFYDGRFAEAAKEYSSIFAKYPDQAADPYMLSMAGDACRKHGRYREAIGYYHKIMSLGGGAKGGLDGLELDYRHEASERLSQSHEALGELKEAIEFALLSHEKYPSTSSCLTCYWFGQMREKLRIARLMMLAGRTDEGLALGEELLFAGGEDAAGLAAVRLLVDHYRRVGKLDQVAKRMDELAIRNLVALRKQYAESQTLPPAELTGETPLLQRARDYTELLQAVERRDVAWLWKQLERLSVEDEWSADAVANTYAWQRPWLMDRCDEIIRSLGEEARPVLLASIHKPSRMQGWALVYLARLRSPEVLPVIRGELARVAAREENVEEPETPIRDYFYALELLNTRSAHDYLDSLEKVGRFSRLAKAAKEPWSVPAEVDDD